MYYARCFEEFGMVPLGVIRIELFADAMRPPDPFILPILLFLRPGLEQDRQNERIVTI
jgi:hypothetical protein